MGGGGGNKKQMKTPEDQAVSYLQYLVHLLFLGPDVFVPTPTSQ